MNSTEQLLMSFRNYQTSHAEFMEAISQAIEKGDLQTASALFDRATTGMARLAVNLRAVADRQKAKSDNG